MKLLAYRQVLPIDTVLVRAALEATLFIVSVLFLLGGLGLLAYGYKVLPHDPLQVIVGFTTLWLSGTGLGLLFSVVSELIPGTGKLVEILFVPCTSCPELCTRPLRSLPRIKACSSGIHLCMGLKRSGRAFSQNTTQFRGSVWVIYSALPCSQYA